MAVLAYLHTMRRKHIQVHVDMRFFSNLHSCRAVTQPAERLARNVRDKVVEEEFDEGCKEIFHF